ncbi:MAG TPA: hypothetical protein VIJ11_12095 [Galbitalea sp.]
MSLTLCCLLWAYPEQDSALIDYEDRVLALLSDHSATLLSRVRSDGADGHPLEVQLFDFPSQASLDSYLADHRRTALAADRDAAIARTELISVSVV